MYININKRNRAFVNITKLLYNAIYSEIYNDSILRIVVKDELVKILRASFVIDRPFYDGRLWLAWTINYLISKEIVEKDEYITKKNVKSLFKTRYYMGCKN